MRYTLRPDPQTGVLHVELSWQTQGREQSGISVARRWGSVADVPALLKNVEFKGATIAGRSGPQWVLDHRRGATITCTYVVSPGTRELSWEDSHLPVTTDRFFHGIGSTFLLVPDPGAGLPPTADAILRWDLPEGWDAVCSWGVGPTVGAPVDLPDLRQSVYLAGRIVKETLEKDGKRVTVALVNEFQFTKDDFAQMSSEIISTQCAFLDERDFPEFIVTAVPVGAALPAGSTRLAGTGLYHSFALFVAPESKMNDAVEHLFAHELFHHWNGRLVRAQQPEELVYWFTEGLTDYYALRSLYDSGDWSKAIYAKWVNRHIEQYHRNPAIRATNEEIRESFWSQRDTVGEVAYQRGMLLGLRWHRIARDQGIGAGLDALFKAILRKARESPGFELSNDFIRSEGIRVLGDWFGPDFDRFVVRAEPVELPGDALAPDFRGQTKTVYEFELGFDREKSLPRQQVVGLREDSPAAKAGLREGDDLVGWAVKSDPNEKAELTVLRGEKTVKIRFFPRSDPIRITQYIPQTERAAGQRR